MIICEYEFAFPDPKDPEISLTEVDYYGHVPYPAIEKGVRNHRLTLRKRMKSGNYEVFRHFHDNGNETLVFAGDLASAIEAARAETVQIWGKDHEIKDEVCRHTEPPIHPFCSMWKRRAEKAAKEQS